MSAPAVEAVLGSLGTAAERTRWVIHPSAQLDPHVLASLPEHRLLQDLAASDAVDEANGPVVLVVDTVADLRRLGSSLGPLGEARGIGCLALRGRQAPELRTRPGWPAMSSLTARTKPSPWLLARFLGPVPVVEAYAELARAVTPHRWQGSGWPVIGTLAEEPHHWPVGAPNGLVGAHEAVHDQTVEYPPDAVVRDDAPGDAASADEGGPHPVLGRNTVTVSVAEADGALALGPVDERVLTPLGFRRMSVGAPAQVEVTGHLLRVVTPGNADVVIDTRLGPTPMDLAALRRTPGLAVDWAPGPTPRDWCRTVVGLAMGGVPILAQPLPLWARRFLDPTLAATLVAPVDLGDLLDREVHNIRQRRAAIDAHSTTAWRAALASATGLQVPARSRVSIVVPTRRPAQLEFVLRQVARQHRAPAEIELVLVGHGHEPDRGVLDRARDQLSGLPEVIVLARTAGQPFGEIINDGAAHASGDLVLKMDDDDWYSTEFLADLLRARAYSGADVVGCPPEFTFVAPYDRTVRRQDATEAWRPIVAGGTALISRELFTAIGGFRSSLRSVDATLFHAARAAGGTVYSSHGHGYVLRRMASGHTWNPGLDYFVSERMVWQEWAGFHPSPLHVVDAVDHPGPLGMPAR